MAAPVSPFSSSHLQESGEASSVFVYVDVLYQSIHSCLFTGLFELRVQEYLESIHENENRRVNRFLKGLGKADFLTYGVLALAFCNYIYIFFNFQATRWNFFQRNKGGEKYNKILQRLCKYCKALKAFWGFLHRTLDLQQVAVVYLLWLRVRGQKWLRPPPPTASVMFLS